MNWLNAVDNILDGAFAPNQETDEDTASNYGSSVTSADHLNDSGTWSDDDSDHHPRLAFTVSEDVIDEEDEAEIAEEDGDEKGEKTEQKSSAKAIAQNPTKPRSTLGMVRPGNIRVMHKRSMSSSSSGEEKDEDSNINSEKISDNESNSDARENGKPAPISLAEEDSILPKKPDFDDTEENSPLKLAIQKESSDNTPVQNKDNPVQTPTTMHSSDFIKKPIDTNSNSVSKPPQQKEIVPSESFHGQEEEDNDIINPQKVDNQSPPQSPQESRIISEIDEASQHLENTPVLTNRSQGATADPRPVPGERSSVKKRNHNCPEIIDHQVEAMSAELEELKAQFDGIVRKEPDPFLGDETENSPEEEMPQSATAIVTVMPTEEPQPDHSLAPSNENYSVRQDSDKGKDEDDDMFEDAVHESDSPGGDIAQTDNSEKISTEGSTTNTSEKIEEKASSVLFDSVVMADSITPQQSNDWSNQRELQLADSEETPLRGVRLSEITLPATNINESLIAVEGVDEVNNDSKPDENSFDDGSIDMNGISEDSKLRQTNATGSSDANSVTSESGNEKAYSRSTSSNDLDQDSALSPGKADLVRSSVHFDVKKALGSWEEDPSEAGMEFKDINRYGAFHIRVLRAQRLPCPVGSTVQASVSLLPWKGRFRSERRATFVLDQESSPSFDHGVCVQWDDKKGDASATISLIHAYAGDATPVPTILINLVLSPVKMLQFSMCSLTLPCDALMKTPGKWRRQWFLAEMQERKNDNDNKLFSEEQTALVEVEAVFVPDDQRFGSSFVSIGQSRAVQDHDEDESSNASNSAEIPEAKTPLATNAEQDNEDDNFIAATKPHLMRVHRFWKPASCSLCSKSLMGWGKQSFRCEVCGLDCCSDCRLHVDLQLPCGSEKATERTGKLIQNKLTISSFLETMAPVDDSYEQKKRELSTIDGDTSLTDTRSLTTHTTRGDRGRIGVMKMNIARACVFESILPATTEPDELVKHTGALRPGDYYVRVCRTGAEGSARTRTIPSPGRLKFEESNEMRLDVVHYGVNFFIEVIDALTDKPVGTSVLTTQGVLQQQRDLMIERGAISIFNIGKKPPVFKGKQRMLLELRKGVKSGKPSDFFVAADSKSGQGEVSGWVEIAAGLEEDVKRLYGPTPYECPPRPPDSFDPSALINHGSRIWDFILEIGELFGAYTYLVSWKNPVLTGFSFIVFVSFTLRFNAEYVGSLPLLFLMLFMFTQAASRSVGASKNRFVQEEADEWNAAEEEIDVNYSIFRPIGSLNITVSKGKNIRSRETGLAGNVGCRVYWDPVRYSSEKQKENIKSIDKSTSSVHDIGSTVSKFTTNPTWNQFNESDESRRLKQVLPHHGHFFETEAELAEESGSEFPVLQPFRKLEDEDESEETPQHINAVLEPWTASPGAVVFQVRFRDILNMLPGSDHIFGEVSIPLSTLVEQGEMSGWFQVLEVGTKNLVPIDQALAPTAPQVIDDTSVVDGLTEAALSNTDVPQIFLTVKWSAPETKFNTQEAEETQREASLVIQEELLRWAVIHKKKDFKQHVVGTIDAFSDVGSYVGTLQMIQNYLGTAADMLEAARNLLNFTDPYKSSMLLAAVSILWFILCLLPTRLIILVAGLAQYGLTLKNKLDKLLKPTHETHHGGDDDVSQASDLDDEEEPEVPIATWVQNAFLGIPTDEDLRKTYFWEKRRIGAKKRDAYANDKRLARLQRLWRAQWHATVKIRDVTAKGRPKGTWVWKTVFAVVQGRRFLWWNTVKDFDNGEAPLGRIFLAGHAGLSGLSPLEMREIDSKEVPFVVGIFGKGLKDQQRVTLLLPSTELKETLENAVMDASVKDD